MKMKNKKKEQEADRRKYADLIKANRRVEPSLHRNEPTKIEIPTILIVCEGKNTEPSYFNQFKLTSAQVKALGKGFNTLSLVKEAIRISKEKNYDQIWCVFDADPKPDNAKQASNFNDAVALAEEQKFGIAYSNQSFEYWIILHFDDHQGGKFSRADYDAKINSLLLPFKMKYDGKGKKIITEEIFNLLEGLDLKTGKQRKRLAIERAKRNYDSFDHKNLATEESTTTMFRLVEELNKHL